MCFLENRFAFIFITSVCFLLMGGCSAPKEAADLTTVLATSASSSGTWRRAEMDLGLTQLAVAHRSGNLAYPLRIYVEGDGRAFAPTGGVSFNPTPAEPVGLKLALADDGEGEVLYMARPCQFVDVAHRPECKDRKLFTDMRWSETLVNAYGDAVLTYIEKGRRVELMGYSGGAYIVLAVASRLPAGSVARIATVAGNLDPNGVHELHGVSRLDDVVVLDYGKLAAIPQVHHMGSRDRVIKPAVWEMYLKAAGEAGRNAMAEGRWQKVVHDAAHTDGWEGVRLP